MSLERTHAMGVSDFKRLSIMRGTGFGIKPVRMGGDVAEQVPRMSGETRLMLRRFERAITQAPGLVEPSEHQIGATHRLVAPAAMTDDSLRQLTIEKLLTLSRPAERLIGSADLSQHPGGGGDCPRKEDSDI